jgi:ABC-type uncharacterized transport system substrate-binding protein
MGRLSKSRSAAAPMCAILSFKPGRSGQVKRRDFITLLSGAAAWPLTARAQQPAVPVIGFLGAPSAKGRDALIAAFRKGLTEVGYSGRAEYRSRISLGRGSIRSAASHGERTCPAKRSCHCCVHHACRTCGEAATSTIPIVLLTGDPVGTRLVASLSRPGGNITGLSYVVPETHGKCVEVLRDIDWPPLSGPGGMLV